MPDWTRTHAEVDERPAQTGAPDLARRLWATAEPI